MATVAQQILELAKERENLSNMIKEIDAKIKSLRSDAVSEYKESRMALTMIEKIISGGDSRSKVTKKEASGAEPENSDVESDSRQEKDAPQDKETEDEKVSREDEETEITPFSSYRNTSRKNRKTNRGADEKEENSEDLGIIEASEEEKDEHDLSASKSVDEILFN